MENITRRYMDNLNAMGLLPEVERRSTPSSSDWLPEDPPQGAAGDHKEEQDGCTDFPEEEVP